MNDEQDRYDAQPTDAAALMALQLPVTPTLVRDEKAVLSEQNELVKPVALRAGRTCRHRRRQYVLDSATARELAELASPLDANDITICAIRVASRFRHAGAQHLQPNAQALQRHI